MSAIENKKLAQRLDAAAALKTYLFSENPAVLALVEKYLEKIKESRGSLRSHDSKIREQLHVLICNFIWINQRQNQWLYQGRGKPSYKRTRYFQVLTKAIFVDCILDSLVSLGLIEQKLGYEDLVKSRVTRIKARGSFKRDINRISPHLIELDPNREVIQVQVTKKTWFDERTQKMKKTKEKLEYEDNHQTRRMRNNLQIINQRLHETHIGLWIKDTDYKGLNLKLKKADKSEFNPNDKYLVRIFNDTGFRLGGRFYHGASRVTISFFTSSTCSILV